MLDLLRAIVYPRPWKQFRQRKKVNTYEIQAIDGTKIPFDKDTNLMIPNNEAYREKRTNLNYFKIHSDYLLQANQILSSSPYASYTPNYLSAKFEDPRVNVDFEVFVEWKNVYLKEPTKGSIAPWSKIEKAYYLSLKTKKERYIYLVLKSGLKYAILDIPPEAIGNAKAYRGSREESSFSYIRFTYERMGNLCWNLRRS